MNETAAEYLPHTQEPVKDKAAGTGTSGEPPLRDGQYDPLEKTTKSSTVAVSSGDYPSENSSPLRVFTLSDILDYEPPAGSLLVGDGIIEQAEIALLFGPPGSYKGFAVGHLMACLAQGHGKWLGFPVKAQCASLWLNCENGRRRLRDQFQKMKLPPEAEKYIYVTDIPAVWNLSDVRLSNEIRRTIKEKQIRLLIIDTVSNFTTDEFAKEFAAFFSSLNVMLHGLDPKPAVLLIHHSRKPKETDKGARGFLNLISGHQTLQRRARSICYLGRVTDAFDEKRLAAVWLKVSNNGQAEGTKTAVQLAEDATLQEIKDFDWTQWDGANSGGARNEPKVKEHHILEIFENGHRKLAHKQAMERLMEVAAVQKSAAYEALKLQGGRFSNLIRKYGELIGLHSEVIPEPESPDSEPTNPLHF